MARRYFLTGAQGCIGAWVVKRLVERGDEPFVFDLSDDSPRLRSVLDETSRARVTFLRGDVTDGQQVRRALERSGATHVIHLAGLQVPVCRVDPVRGALVNVIGTLNVFEALRQLGLDRIAYASSAAVYGASDAVVDESVRPDPATHYGVFKQANEGNARVYFQDHGIRSVGLRPLTVYGVGRDQGLTSDPTRALKAALLERDFAIRFRGPTDFLYVADAAAAFVGAVDHAPEGAHVFNVHGETDTVEAFVARAERHLPDASRGRIRVEGAPIPIAATMDDAALRRAVPDLPLTRLEEGIPETIHRFVALRDQGRLEPYDLEP